MMQSLPAVLLLSCFILIGINAQSQKKSHHRRSKSESKRVDHNSARRSTGYNLEVRQEPASMYLRTSASSPVPGPPPQNPLVWDALDILRGRPPLTAKEAIDVMAYAQGGKDYPVYLEVPKTYFSCGNTKPGFYADLDTYCQVYHRCDIGGKQTTYLCPTKTLFNQVTLVCDWFYNINCQNSRQFIEYSNSRLYYPQWQLLDTQENYVLPFLQQGTVPQLQGPPPVLYGPGKQPPGNQAYTQNINGHENPDYQMSVVIRNPQMVPDYNIEESRNKEYLDQGSTVSLPMEQPLEVRRDPNPEQMAQQASEQAWRQQFRQGPETEKTAAVAPSVNVTVSLGDSPSAPVVKISNQQAPSYAQEQTA